MVTRRHGGRCCHTPCLGFELMSTRAYQGLLRPTSRQECRLGELLEAQRQLYNAALEERRGAWRWERRSVTRFEQFGALTGWDHPLLEFGVIPARGTLLRLDRAFQAFFRRLRAGQRPGFPRFKSASRFAAVEYPDRACWRIEGNRLYLRGVGNVRFRTSRRGILGVPKTLAVRKEGRRWRFTVFCAHVPEQPLEPTGRSVGLDLGVTVLAATSDGELVANPRWVQRSLDRLANAQRLIAGRQHGSARRAQSVERVGALHRRVARQRRDAHHKLSRRLVASYDVIAHERLQISNMTRRPKLRSGGEDAFKRAAAKTRLNREILSAGWGQLLRMIAYKAEEAGRTVIAVDPKHTSRTCHQCGHVDVANRVGTAFRCARCGHSAHADVNAARNILRAGLAQRLAREAA
jgi:putative transposase